MRHVKTCSALLLTMLTLAAPATAQTARAASAGKPGGVLKPVLREDLPQGFAIHESATNSVTWPAMLRSRVSRDGRICAKAKRHGR